MRARRSQNGFVKAGSLAQARPDAYSAYVVRNFDKSRGLLCKRVLTFAQLHQARRIVGAGVCAGPQAAAAANFGACGSSGAA